MSVRNDIDQRDDELLADTTIDNRGPGDRISFGPFSLAPAERLLMKHGMPVDIGGRSFDLLVALTDRPGQVLSKRDLLKRVWPDVVVEDGSLRFHMAGLRKLLGDGDDGARYIATQVGVGYAFVAPFERTGAAVVPDAAPQPAPPLPNPTNLPPRLARLIGRSKDLQLLADRVAQSPLFTIAGPGGVGKTALAVALGHELAPRFENRVAFVDFAMLENPAIVPSMIAGAMGLAVPTDDPLSVILRHIGDREVLLVLDNCEHVIDPTAEIVERIVEQAPNAHILVTSREPLRIRDENVHRLDALDYPEDPESLGRAELLAYPAVELFCERAGAANTALEIDEEAARLIADMCRRLDGMALPIELAAVRVATHGIAATARQLGERFSLAWPGRRTASPRQQTLQSTLDWSYDLLSRSEQAVLERLAIFVGPFSIDAALEVGADAEIGFDEVALALDELVTKSLVSTNRALDTGAYRLLEMTRSYSREKLRSRGSADYRAAAGRHAGFFLGELETAAERDAEALRDLKTLRPQLGNIRSALDWCFGADGEIATGVRLAAASAPVFLAMSHVIECRKWCTKALAGLDADQQDGTIERTLREALGAAEAMLASPAA
jgi:predicted ATPase/DNA-binding winged helix-turn-helix (wHTH) protein